jgi:hypothetical protein
MTENTCPNCAGENIPSRRRRPVNITSNGPLVVVEIHDRPFRVSLFMEEV